MLYETISNDMKEAMKNHDKDTLSTLRLLKSAVDAYIINNKMERGTASDEVVIDVVSKQVKTHKESIEQFKAGNRQDLVDGLNREIDRDKLNKFIDKDYRFMKQFAKNAPNKRAIAPIDEVSAFANFNCSLLTTLVTADIFAG